MPGVDPMSLILGGGNLLGGIVSGFIGAGQRSKGKHLLSKSPHLDYQVPPEAIQAASEGLPSEQYAKAMKNIQAQQAAAITAAQDRRSGLAAIGRTQALTDSAMGDLDSRNAMARMQNQRLLTQYRDKGWDVKNKQREEDRAYAYGLMGAGGQNVASGLDKGLAGLAGIGYGLFGDDSGGGGTAGGSRRQGGSGFTQQYGYGYTPMRGYRVD